MNSFYIKYQLFYISGNIIFRIFFVLPTTKILLENCERIVWTCVCIQVQFHKLSHRYHILVLFWCLYLKCKSKFRLYASFLCKCVCMGVVIERLSHFKCPHFFSLLFESIVNLKVWSRILHFLFDLTKNHRHKYIKEKNYTKERDKWQ